MVLLSCSGTGGGIYAKLANGVTQYNCAQIPSPQFIGVTISCTSSISGVTQNLERRRTLVKPRHAPDLYRELCQV
jgi:hypothetical protein